MSLSPMMQQYLDISAKYPDCILFFRLGDFYEMFFEDAKVVSKELDLVLTGKQCGLPERAPMCGVPFHACDSYIAKLVEKGYKIAICEQMEDPASCKGLVPREVVQIVTPGTVTKETMLSEKENNYIASIFTSEDYISLCYSDITTGELASTIFVNGREGEQTLINELVRINVRELVLSEEAAEVLPLDEVEHLIHPFMNRKPSVYFDRKACEATICKQFGISSAMGLGLGDHAESICAVGGLLIYLSETQKGLEHLKNLTLYEVSGHMSLDRATIRNLELTETLYEKRVQGSLLWVLDKCGTAMGSRKLKQWLREPLCDSAEINRRLDAVETLFDSVLLRNDLREALKGIYDLERLAGRIATGGANGKDMIALRNSIASLPEIKLCLEDFNDGLLSEINADINPLRDIYEKIDAAIVSEPPMTIKEGGLIKSGYSKELDDLKAGIKDAKLWIASLESTEKQRTGITHLKVGFNKVFGYYIEVSKSNLDMIPENYIRKQTLVGAERFITPELKEMESLVLNAETKINQLEYELFCELRALAGQYTGELQKTASAIAVLDVLCSFAEVSSRLGYVKPDVSDSDEIYIRGGRHPVIEQTITDGLFVANDTYCNLSDASMLLITGPNMAGKSTYMRQTALIVLMAQAGCFVPCESAKIGVCDRIFTRIGASDNLAMGQSTFFVEMSELAYILNCSTRKSLIILDEIGRGTSTYDGLSIAWAVVNHLCSDRHRARTLFATHYHELTSLEGTVKGCRNLNVDVADTGGDIVFLHKIVPGPASRSYGIHVAKLAGVPKQVLDDAEARLADLESSDSSASLYAGGEANSKRKGGSGSGNADESGEMQISMFDFAPNPVVEQLKALNLMDIRPSEAIKILEELQELARKNL